MIVLYVFLWLYVIGYIISLIVFSIQGFLFIWDKCIQVAGTLGLLLGWLPAIYIGPILGFFAAILWPILLFRSVSRDP